MNSFNGIPISESRLLAHGIVFTVMLLLSISALGFDVYASLSKNRRDRGHLKKLKEKARTDELTKKRLRKIQHKNRRQRERRKSDRFFEAFVTVVLVCLAASSLSCSTWDLCCIMQNLPLQCMDTLVWASSCCVQT